MRALLEMWVLFEGGPYMRKYGTLIKNTKLKHVIHKGSKYSIEEITAFVKEMCFN